MFVRSWSPPKTDIYLHVYVQITHKLFSLHILYLHEVKPSTEIWLSNSSCFRKLFVLGLLTAVVLYQRERSPRAEEGSRVFAFTLFPFLSKPQKAHFGSSPTKTSPIVLNGACIERVQEWLCNLGHRFHPGMCILHTLQDSGHWSTPRKPCRVHVFQDLLWLKDLSSRFPSLSVPHEILVFPL